MLDLQITRWVQHALATALWPLRCVKLFKTKLQSGFDVVMCCCKHLPLADTCPDCCCFVHVQSPKEVDEALKTPRNVHQQVGEDKPLAPAAVAPPADTTLQLSADCTSTTAAEPKLGSATTEPAAADPATTASLQPAEKNPTAEVACSEAHGEVAAAACDPPATNTLQHSSPAAPSLSQAGAGEEQVAREVGGAQTDHALSKDGQHQHSCPAGTDSTQAVNPADPAPGQDSSTAHASDKPPTPAADTHDTEAAATLQGDADVQENSVAEARSTGPSCGGAVTQHSIKSNSSSSGKSGSMP